MFSDVSHTDHLQPERYIIKHLLPSVGLVKVHVQVPYLCPQWFHFGGMTRRLKHFWCVGNEVDKIQLSLDIHVSGLSSLCRFT